MEIPKQKSEPDEVVTGIVGKDRMEIFKDKIQERSKRRHDTLFRWTDFLFELEPKFDVSALIPKGSNKEDSLNILKSIRKELKKNVENPALSTIDGLKAFILDQQEKLLIDKKPFLLTIRAAVTGSSRSLPLYESMLLLGLYGCLVRFDQAMTFVKRQR